MPPPRAADSCERRLASAYGLCFAMCERGASEEAPLSIPASRNRLLVADERRGPAQEQGPGAGEPRRRVDDARPGGRLAERRREHVVGRRGRRGLVRNPARRRRTGRPRAHNGLTAACRRGREARRRPVAGTADLIEAAAQRLGPRAVDVARRAAALVVLRLPGTREAP